VKLWSEQNQRLAATVSQFHSLVFEVLLFGGVFALFSPRIERIANSEKLLSGLIILRIASFFAYRAVRRSLNTDR
jgi:hypothetical protein